jgi:hypothetical protein
VSAPLLRLGLLLATLGTIALGLAPTLLLDAVATAIGG